MVEELRRIFIQHREIQHRELPHPEIASSSFKAPDLKALDFKDPLLNQARNIISSLTVEEAHRVTKAFAIYFELTNLAETNHRKRRRRAAKLNASSHRCQVLSEGPCAECTLPGIDVRSGLAALRQDKSRAGLYRASH